MRSNKSVAVFGDACRGLRLPAEGRRYPARVHKAIYGLMARVVRSRTVQSLQVYCSLAGVLSALSAISTQLRAPIDSGVTRWRGILNKYMDAAAGLQRNPVSKHQYGVMLTGWGKNKELYYRLLSCVDKVYRGKEKKKIEIKDNGHYYRLLLL